MGMDRGGLAVYETGAQSRRDKRKHSGHRFAYALHIFTWALICFILQQE